MSKRWLKYLGVFAILCVCLLLFGRIPLKQLEQQPSSTPFNMNYDNGCVLLSIGNGNGKKLYEIVEAESYASDESGKRYPISVRPHDYDLSQKFPYIRDEIYVFQSREAKKAMSLHNGIWTFYLTLEENGQRLEKEFSFRLWTFYYNPIFHGPPN
jgi:hypothetical protein